MQFEDFHLLYENCLWMSFLIHILYQLENERKIKAILKNNILEYDSSLKIGRNIEKPWSCIYYYN